MTDESADERWQRLSQDRVDRPLPKRFYGDVSVGPDLQILLDGRAVKTPLKVPLVLPRQSLADAVAAEWIAQDVLINPALMPLTKLANTAIDRAGPERAFVAGEIESFATNDLTFYRADAPAELVRMQEEQWDPVLSLARVELGASFKTTHSIRHVPQSDEAIAAIKAHIAELEPFALTVAHNLTTLTGSGLMALMMTAGAVGADAVWTAAHVDEDFQIRQWGEDFEASRRRQNRRAEFDATAEFLKLLRQ